MKKLALAATALTILTAFPAFAQRNDESGRWSSLPRSEQSARDDSRDNRGERNWSRGDRLPPRYRQDSYYVRDYKRYDLRKPGRGQRWVRVDDRYFLTAMSNGYIIEMVLINDRRYDDRDDRRGAPVVVIPQRSRDDLWRARYSRAYTINDDSSYTECRNGPDPTGVLAGALLGGLLGRTVAGRGDRTEGAVVGVIAGGAIGAALTNKVKCEDRSYMYKTYNDGFNNSRPNAYYKWNNPRNDHRGELNVLDYYEDEDNFRCAVYANTIYIDGRREEARGRACQQPNGTWAIID